MTAVVALARAGVVTVGGDAAGVDAALDAVVEKETKVWRAGPLVLGASGSYRVGQLIRWRMTTPVPEDSMDPLAYLAGPFADAVRAILTEGGALTTWQEDATEAAAGSSLIVGLHGRAFAVMEDFGVSEPATGYTAIGCGAPYALGALAATEHIKDARKRVRVALAAAERHSAGVRGPMHIEVTKK